MTLVAFPKRAQPSDTDSPANVLDYGVRADAQVATDVVCTSGSAVVTSAAGLFRRHDVGKVAFLGGTDSTNTHYLMTTVLSYQSATQVTLAANAPYSGTAQRLSWGTDNASRIQAAMDDALYLFFPAGRYLAKGNLVPRSSGRYEGAGSALTYIDWHPTALSQAAFYCVGLSDVHVHDLYITGHGSRGVAQVKTHFTYAGSAGILFRNCFDCEVRRVHIEGGAVALYHDNTADDLTGYAYTTNSGHITEDVRAEYTAGGAFFVMRADNCKWTNCHSYYSGSDGFKIQELSRNCHFSDISARFGGRDGMDTFNGLVESTVRGAIFTDNLLFGVEFKGLFGGSYGLSDYVDRELVVDGVVTARNGDCGVSCVSLHNCSLSNIMSSGDNDTPYGFDEEAGTSTTLACSIRFANCQNLSLSNLVASKGAHHGIGFEGCGDIVGASLMAMDNSWTDGTTQSGLWHGVFFDAACGRIQIYGLRSGNSVATGVVHQVGGQGYGAYCTDGCAQVQIVGLNAKGCVTGTFYDSLLVNFATASFDILGAGPTGWKDVPFSGTGTHTSSVAPISRLSFTPRALSANNASPDPPESNFVYTQNTLATNLSNIGGGQEGMELTLHARDAVTTLKHNASGVGNLRLSGSADRLLALNEFVVLLYYGTLWYEVAPNGPVALPRLPMAAAGKVLRATGVSSATAFSAATFPDTATQGDLLHASAANTWAPLPAVAAGSYLRSAGTGTAPAYSTLTLPNAATTGDLLAATATNTAGAIAAAAAGKVLRAAGAGTLPAWSTATYPGTVAAGALLAATGADAVGSIAAVAAGSVLRAAGTGTLPAYSAFTIPDTFATGGIPYASNTNVLSSLAVGGANTVLKGGGSTPAYGALVAADIPSLDWAKITTGSLFQRLTADVALAASTTVDLPLLNIAVAASEVWECEYFLVATVTGGTAGLKYQFATITGMTGWILAVGVTSSATTNIPTPLTTNLTAVGATAYITGSFSGFIHIRAYFKVGANAGTLNLGLTTGASAAGNILAGSYVRATRVP